MIRYTEKHPTIIEIKETIVELKKMQLIARNEAIQQATKGALASTSDSSEVNPLNTYSSLISNLESEKDLLEAQLVNTKNKRDSLASKINLIPEIEAELVELNRDYQNNLKFYENLVNRKISAEISRDADKDTQNVKFKVIEEPRVAKTPVGPPRSILYALVFFLSIVLGLFASLIASQISPVVVNKNHLESLIGRCKVIGCIQNTSSDKIKRRNKFKRIAVLIYFIGLTAMLIALIAHEIIIGQSPFVWLPKLGIYL